MNYRRHLLFVVAFACLCGWFGGMEEAGAAPGTITTVVGNGEYSSSGDGGLAIQAGLRGPTDISLDGESTLYIAEPDGNRIRKVDALGIITTVAGDGRLGFSGDGGLATQASLNTPVGVSADGAGNLYIADTWNHRIRKVDASGIITTVAGNGVEGFSGDGGPAVQASLNAPNKVFVDGKGNLYIVDRYNNRVRKVEASTGIITTVAGNGDPFGALGDDGPATSASLRVPQDVFVDDAGNLYIADEVHDRIRKVDGSTGIITTAAGNGDPFRGFSGDGGPAINARLNQPTGVFVDGGGNLYIADWVNQRIRMVDRSGVITTVAGNGIQGFSGDGELATQSSLNGPTDVVVDRTGNLYILDLGNNRIRRVEGIAAPTILSRGVFNPPTTIPPSDTIPPFVRYSRPENGARNVDLNAVTRDGLFVGFSEQVDTVLVQIRFQAGEHTLNWQPTWSGSPDTLLHLRSTPDNELDFDTEYRLFLAQIKDKAGNTARDTVLTFFTQSAPSDTARVDTTSGVITTVAGNGEDGFSGDGGPAIQARLWSLWGVFAEGMGNLYIADMVNNRVRKVDPSGIITTVAGNGIEGFSGDGGLAIQASLRFPHGVFVDGGGNLYIADSGNHRIRKVDPSGIITTVAGDGMEGFSGDGGQAVQASLQNPRRVFVDGGSNLYISDTYNHRIRKVDPSGIITTVAGNGIWGFSGDGGPAIQANVGSPWGVFVDGGGNLYIADSDNHRVRKVDPAGIITTVAGDGFRDGQTRGRFFGDEGPAIQASLWFPLGVFVDGGGNLYIADSGNHRIRKVDPSGIITTVAGSGTFGLLGDGGPATQASMYPTDLSADGKGNLYIADSGNRIRRVAGVATPTLLGGIVASTPDTTSAFAAAKTFTVNSTGDGGDSYPGDRVCADGSGDCTLRAAIEEANASAGTDTIRFDISGPAPHTISPSSALPEITSPIVIDGTSEPDFAGVPAVELEGSRAGENVDGLHLRAGNSTVKGLAVNRFGTGIYLETKGDNVIQGNFIGTDITGTLELGNVTGLIIQDAPGNIIGGLAPEARNVISGNQFHGFTIIGERAMGNLVQGNYIGTDRTGTMDLGNRGVGVVINAPGNTIGGTTVMARNVISGNDSAGVVIGGEATGNVVQGNFIGTGVTGMTDLGNGSEGVVIAASDNTIGGREKGAGNIIAFNGRGVFVYSGSGNAILANAIHSNKGLGIDLRPDGTTANDASDRDMGANNLQNFPVLNAVSLDSSALSGTFSSTASTPFRFEFFASTTCDDSGKGEGEVFLDSLSTATDRRGQAHFRISFSAALVPGEFITATATPPDNSTSEFCGCVSVPLLAVEPASKDSTNVAGSEAPPLEEEAVNPLSGDFDQNGKVEFADFFLFVDAFGGTEPLFDLDGSGSVDFADFFLFSDHFGAESQAKLMDLAHEYIGLSILPQLGQSFPNPFNNSTTIRYQVVEHGQIRLELFDLMGQRVKTLVDDYRGPGVYAVSWDGTNGRGVGVSTGIYLVRLQVGAFTQVGKMALVK